MIQAITFDLDNTLWEVDPVIIGAEQAHYRWLQQHAPRLTEQFTQDALREHKNQVVTQSPAIFHKISELRITALNRALQQVGYPATDAAQLAQQAFEVFFHARQEVELYQYALDILEQLHQHYRLGALTNGNADIHLTGIGHYFDFAFSAEEIGAPKPEPALFQAALDHTGLEPQQVVHIGDHPEHDVRGAMDMGLHTVWVNLKRDKWPGREKADVEINCLSELPEAIDLIIARNHKAE